jgi:hypothetical protein
VVKLCGAAGGGDEPHGEVGEERSDWIREHALDVGEEVRGLGGVPRRVAAASRGLEVEDGD